MRPSDPGRDRAGWLAVAWAVGFGLLYLRTVLRARAPGLWEAIVAAAPPLDF